MGEAPMTAARTVMYSRFERFWHWMQAVLMLFLALTGFEIHGTLEFFGFEQAVRYHNAAANALMILIAFAIFWHLTTGEWRQYIPTTRRLRAQVAYYLAGIFTDAPHPDRKTRVSKLNPLQRIVYLQLKLLAIPVMVVSGLLYMLYRYPQRHGIAALDVGGLETFVIVHVYLISTGVTLTSNLKAMITGYEDAEEPAAAASPAAAAGPTESSCAPTI
jgi:thiosulfate reductase cytochrome b subunit